jgi:hypothetical protein
MDNCTNEREQVRGETARKRREAKSEIENLFFEMSRPVESPKMLKSWVEWFRRLHIPCAIVKTEAGYTLWRKGKEAGPRGSKIPSLLTEKNVIFSFGVSARQLEQLKEKQQEKSGDARSQSSEGYEDITVPRWDEQREGLNSDSTVPPKSLQCKR